MKWSGLNRRGPSLLMLITWGLQSYAGDDPSQVFSRCHLLNPSDFEHHVIKFNMMEEERVVNLISNDRSWDWLVPRIPFFDCPDTEVAEIYYFRWWALRKHLKLAGTYEVFSEFIELKTQSKFIPPELTISSALGHHFRETRWLSDQGANDSYVDYWLFGNEGDSQSHLHRYSSWLVESLWQRALVSGDFEFLEARIDSLLADFRQWQEEHLTESGLYWSFDVRDAMEESISGSRTVQQYRPTLNSYMYGNALALAKIFKRLGESVQCDQLATESEALRASVQTMLWNPEHQFFEVFNPETGKHAGVRELLGYIPWYFKLPEAGKGYGQAWGKLRDSQGFWAPYGLTTAEQSHAGYRTHGTGTCEWDGAVWPFATSQTLSALANGIRDYPPGEIKPGKEEYFDAFLSYTRSQYYEGLPYIGEYLDGSNGSWLKGRDPRSFYYHHSTYADLLIGELIGICPQEEDQVVIIPLIPPSAWNWFCLDAVPYHGHILTVFWDLDGTRYGQGEGFHLWIDGEPSARLKSLGEIRVEIP